LPDSEGKQYHLVPNKLVATLNVLGSRKKKHYFMWMPKCSVKCGWNDLNFFLRIAYHKRVRFLSRTGKYKRAHLNHILNDYVNSLQGQEHSPHHTSTHINMTQASFANAENEAYANCDSKK